MKKGQKRSAYPGLWEHPKTGIYWFRLPLPRQVQDQLGRKVVLKTLETRDRQAAIVKWCGLNAEWRAKITAVRSGELRRIDNHVANLIARDLIAGESLKFKSRGDIEQFTARQLAAAKGQFDIGGRTIVTGSLTERDRESITRSVEDLYLFMTASESEQLRIEADQLDRDAKSYRQHHPDAPKGDQPRLRDAYDEWKRATNPKHSSASDFLLGVSEFVELNGDYALVDLRADHFRAYRKWLRDAKNKHGNPMSPSTRAKRFGGVKAIVSHAVDEGWLSAHPGGDVAMDPVPQSNLRRTGWTDSELRRLFTSPVFMKAERFGGSGGEAAYWLPVIEAYSGARLSELAQLDRDDVIEQGGILALKISADQDGQSIKTEESFRLVPVHAKLIELGFGRYLATIKSGKLFPELKPDSRGVPGGLFSKWFGGYRRSIGLDRDGCDFHALRHNFKTLLRGADADSEIKAALVGHSTGNVSAKYGMYPLKHLKAAIDQVELGVSIPRWKPGRTVKFVRTAA